MADYKKQSSMNPAPEAMPGDMPGAMPGDMPGVLPGGGMSPDDMMEDLDSSLQDVKRQEAAVNSQGYISKNKIEAAKASLVQSIFKILEDAGVDPTNIDSIQNFIKTLQENDPDLLRLFNYAFDVLSTMPDKAPEIAGNLGASADMPIMPPPGVSDPLAGGPPPSPAEAPGVGPSTPSGPVIPTGPEGPGGKYGNIAGMMPK